MLVAPIIDIQVVGKPVTFGDKIIEKPWKDLIKKAFVDWHREPLDQTIIILDFSLDISRFTRKGRQTRNDLDNLAKPVLDALVERGIINSDSDVLDLLLRKRTKLEEGVRIRIYNWNESVLPFQM